MSQTVQNQIYRDFQSAKVTGKALRTYFGLKKDPIQYEIGQQIGHVISPHFRSASLPDLLVELSNVWRGQGLGNMQVLETAPLVKLKVSDCFDCPGAPDIGQTLCAFKRGMLKAIFDDKLNLRARVHEEACCGTGADHCAFTIGFLPKKVKAA